MEQPGVVQSLPSTMCPASSRDGGLQSSESAGAATGPLTLMNRRPYTVFQTIELCSRTTVALSEAIVCQRTSPFSGRLARSPGPPSDIALTSKVAMLAPSIHNSYWSTERVRAALFGWGGK